MDFELNEDQAVLVSAVQSVCSAYEVLPDEYRRSYHYWSTGMQRALDDNGFLDAIHNGLTALYAALVVFETARSITLAEVAASALVAPHLLDERPAGPIALIEGALTSPQRLLPVARTAIIDVGDDVIIMPIDQNMITPTESILAYPYGRFRANPDLTAGRRLGTAAVPGLRQWRRVAIALECAAAARSAIDFTVDWVKQRMVFGRAIGSFQAIQHRLAQCHVIASGLRLVAFHAAWSGKPEDADLAATYAQQHVHKLVFDLHQFNGGMGVTNEHSLHFWTYRLRALQAEVGGTNGAALAVADARWPLAAA